MRLIYKNNFWGYFHFYYRIVGNRLVLFLGLSIVISFLDGLGLAMFIPLLDTVGNASHNGGNEESLGQLRYFTLLMKSMGLELNVTTVLMSMAVLFILKGMLKLIQLTFYAKLRQIFIKRVRYKLVNNLEGLSYDAFLKLDAGKIQNTLTGEVARLFQTMTSYFNAAQAFGMLATYMVLAFLANYQFAVLVGVGGALSNLIYKKIYKATKKASIELSTKGSDFNSFLVQAIHYFKYLKSTNSFNGYSNKLRRVIDETEFINRRIGNLNAITTSVKEPIIVIIVVLVILFQLNWMHASLSTIILSLLLFYRALSFLVTIQNHWQTFIENSGGMNSVALLSEEMAGLQESYGNTSFSAIQREMVFKDVIFYYDKKRILNGINITIPKNQTIALVGESGAGKTTIANMIASLIRPFSGEITIDGHPLQQFDLNVYRSKIGYISQESVIFNDTLYNNITFWAEPSKENIKRFNEILMLASLTDFVQSLPDKEFTNLGDNGILISGGQKQRISIARELFKKTEILIFDEATSALDSETEKIIQQNIERMRGSYTMILIAHRLSTIKEADIIYLIEKGEVSACGSFQEMINISSRFKKMVSLQGF